MLFRKVKSLNMLKNKGFDVVPSLLSLYIST